MKSFFLFVLFFYPAFLLAGPLSGLVNTDPTQGSILNEDNYSPFQVQRLERPLTIYQNRALMTDMGADISGLSDEALKKETAHALGWVSSSLEPLNGTNQITAYADYYGGLGMGAHQGSARAGIIGQVQIKGIGTTPLYRGDHGGKHDGRAGFHEAIKEVIWGNFLENELPYGANRVVGLVDSGLVKQDGEKHVLIVRENPIRAGHFITRDYQSDDADRARAKGNRKNLSKYLPNRNTEASIIDRYLTPHADPEFTATLYSIEEWLYRLSRQTARAYARRLFHGATSESNINMNAQFIDYGTASTNSGYGEIRFLRHVEGFGQFDEVEQLWGPGFTNRILDDFNDSTIQKSLSNVSSRRISSLIWKTHFKQALSDEFLLLIGFPKSTVTRLQGNESALKLGYRLFELSKASGANQSFDIQNAPMPDSTGKYDFPKFLTLLSNAMENAGELESFLDENPKLISKEELIELRQLQIEVFQEVKASLVDQGIPSERILSLFRANAEWLNKDLEELYINNLRSFTENLNERYRADPGIDIQTELDNYVLRNAKEVRGLPERYGIRDIKMTKSNRLQITVYDVVEDREKDLLGDLDRGRIKISNSHKNCLELAREVLGVR